MNLNSSTCRSGKASRPTGADDHKSATVVARRAGDSVARCGRIRVRQPPLVRRKDGLAFLFALRARVDSLGPQGAGGTGGFDMNDLVFTKETLNKSSYRRRTEYNSLIFMDSRLRGNDEF
jgi:hypothetical protein